MKMVLWGIIKRNLSVFTKKYEGSFFKLSQKCQKIDGWIHTSKEAINSQSLEDTQLGSFSQKYSLEIQKYHQRTFVYLVWDFCFCSFGLGFLYDQVTIYFLKAAIFPEN